MSPDSRKINAIFRRTGALLCKVAGSATRDHVHHFRTSVLRLEALLITARAADGPHEARLLRDLGKLRRRAGKVRDCDVQLSILDDVAIMSDGRRKRALAKALEKKRDARLKALERALNPQRVSRTGAQLKAVAQHFDASPMPLHLPALSGEPLHAGNLHEFRKSCKQLRYIAELYHDPAAKLLTADLKRLQDTIGDWHDWSELTRRAEKLLRGRAHAPLLAALRNIAAAKLHQALHGAQEARRTLVGPAVRRGPARESAPAARAGARAMSA